jgi:CheY-like chemotaxis protein
VNRKILIIDDNKGDIQLIKELLDVEGMDFDVIWAENGIDGLDLADREEPDIILLDTRMPGVDGNEICQRLKDPARKKAHVIMMTGALGSFDQGKAKESGADDYCIKLHESIVAALGRYTQRGYSS